MARQGPVAVDCRAGLAELALARAATGKALALAFVFSAFVNLLMLTAPIYMLQVYDRVLVSRSEETLVALSLLAAFLFLVMGILDHARGRIMARIGARMQIALDRRVQAAALARLMQAPGDGPALSAQSDLDAITRLWASPVLLAVFDAPWTPLFLAVIFVLHPLLGWLALLGGASLVAVTWVNQRMTEAPLAAASLAAAEADRDARAQAAEGEVLRALGMQEAAFARWQLARSRALRDGLAVADVSGGWAVVSRTLRLFLQSAMLGLAAWLVLLNEVSAGAMLAAAVLMGRALQPVEQAVGQWATVARARLARDRLAGLLTLTPPPPQRTALPRPRAALEVRDLAILPPGATAPVLRGVSFSLAPGQAIGVIGPSGSGKSSLARVLVGVLRPASGQVRLDGAALEQFDPAVLGGLVGYLPQRPVLFDGTVAENIARLDGTAAPDRIIAAARAADAHDMILRLPDGYDFRLSAPGVSLSGGQAQRVALARALFGDPLLVVLDEPNANLDNDGTLALNQAVRGAKARGAAVLVMAHRPAALQECDMLLVLKDGAVAAFGARDEVLRQAVRNAGDIAGAVAARVAG
jgi:ATP-binding cassette subfamily C protein